MLEVSNHIKNSKIFSTQSSTNIMAMMLSMIRTQQKIQITNWMLQTSLQMRQPWSGVQESELEETWLDSHWVQVSMIQTQELKSKEQLWKLLIVSVGNFREPTILSTEWAHKFKSKWLKTISYSKREIDSWNAAESMKIGHITEVFSTMLTRLSLYGLMRKINWELFQCSQVQISDKSSRDLCSHFSNSNRLPNSHMIQILVISPHAQLTWELLWEHQSISAYHFWAKEKKSSRKLQKNIMSKLEELMVSTLRQMMEFSIFQIREDLEFQWCLSFKICIMV